MQSHMQFRWWKKFAALALLGLVACCLNVGCVGRFTGGGWIDSIEGAPKKATFGFVINASEPDASGNATLIEGQFQYNDHGAGVKFHVDQLEPIPLPYARIYPDIFNPQAVLFAYHGTYTSDDGTGELDLGMASDQQSIFDPVTGTPQFNSDAVFVHVYSGPYAGYDNAGLVQGGNVQFFPGD